MNTVPNFANKPVSLDQRTAMLFPQSAGLTPQGLATQGLQTCGMTSALAAQLPYQTICWRETCPNIFACPKNHLSLLAISGQAGLPIQSQPRDPNFGLQFQPPSAHVMPGFLSNRGPIEAPFNLSGHVAPRPNPLEPQAPVQTVQGTIPSWKDTLRQAIEARQSKPPAVKCETDSGVDSPHKLSRDSSTSPKSDGQASGSTSSGYKSPHSSILATMLQGGQAALAGQKAFEGQKGQVSFDLDEDSPSEDSAKSSPKQLTLLKPVNTANLQNLNAGGSFLMSQILNKEQHLSLPESLPERTQTPPYQMPPTSFGSLYSNALPPLSAVAPFLSNNGLASDPKQNFLPGQMQAFAGAFQPVAPAQIQPPHAKSPRTDSYRPQGGPLQIHPLDQSKNNSETSKSRSPWAVREQSPSSFTSHSSTSPRSGNLLLPTPSSAVCVVCEDKASGYHYGVISCEGCKGFFRRTVQKNIDYNCHKDSQCPVNRITRNRCQACRFNKCLNTGMTKESVRQDRNRKRKIKNEQQEEELKETARMQQMIQSVVNAHHETSTVFSLDRPVPDVVAFLAQQLETHAPAQISEFASKIPGFSQLDIHDRNQLLRAAFLEILGNFVRLVDGLYESFHFEIQTAALQHLLLRTAFLYCGQELQTSDRPAIAHLHQIPVRELTDCVRKLRDSFFHLQIFNEEIALLSAVCLLCPTRTGLKSIEQVEKLQEQLLESLRVQIQLRRPQYQNVFAKLLMKISDLRTITNKALESNAAQ